MEFRIIEVPGEDQINPFKQYQRRRGGRVGQSFYASIVCHGGDAPTYAGDVMLAGWGDSSDKGQWISFWLDEDASVHPFAGFARRTAGAVGQLFTAIIVITTEPGGSATHAHELGSQPTSKRKLSAEAHLIITGGRFIQWLREKSRYTAALSKQGRDWNPETARKYVKWKLQIESLSDLDRSPEKAESFHALFRVPFSKWDGKE